MPQPQTFTTRQAIGAVYDWLGPGAQKAVPPNMVCTRAWAMLGKLQSLLGITDRTHYLFPIEFTIPANQLEYELPENAQNFGNELAFERVDRSSGYEVMTPVPLVSDMRDVASASITGGVGVAAYLYINPETGKRWIRFSYALNDTYTFRMWVEPGVFARPGLGEQPLLPEAGLNLWVIETAKACCSEMADVLSPAAYKEKRDELNDQRADFRQIYDNWRMKGPGASNKKRRAYNERRRPHGFSGGPRSDFPLE